MNQATILSAAILLAGCASTATVTDEVWGLVQSMDSAAAYAILDDASRGRSGAAGLCQTGAASGATMTSRPEYLGITDGKYLFTDWTQVIGAPQSRVDGRTRNVTASVSVGSARDSHQLDLSAIEQVRVFRNKSADSACIRHPNDVLVILQQDAFKKSAWIGVSPGSVDSVVAAALKLSPTLKMKEGAGF